MICTTECWNCEDKNCKNYISKQQLFFNNQLLKSVLDEIREVIIELRNIIYNPDYENFGLSREQYKDRFIHIFEILDKVEKYD